MSICESKKIDSNITGLSFAEEVCLKELSEDAAAAAATGTIIVASNPIPGDVLSIGNEAYTFVASGPSGAQILIGADANATAGNIRVKVSADSTLVDIAGSGNTLAVTAVTAGEAGNDITMSATGTAFNFSSGKLKGGHDTTTDPTWYDLEPNSYSDLGGELTTLARSPIDPSRQNKKGNVTDLDADGGFNQDFTQTNSTRLLQGFFFADARQAFSTAPMNGPQIDLTAVTTTQYQALSGLAAPAAGNLVLAEGLGNPNNNGVKRVTGSAAGALTVAEVLVAEANPPAAAKLTLVGHQFASGDLTVQVVNGRASLVATAANFTTLFNQLGLIPGTWIFLGGDAVATRFDNNVGYARIGTIADKSVILDDVTWEPLTDAGAGKTVRMFVPLTIRNEKNPALIKRRSYNIERTLGEGENGTQAEYLEGAVANELTLNVPQADKLNVDMSFVACDNTYRSGDPGDERKVGDHISAPGEDAYNTTSDLYRLKLSIVDPVKSNPSDLFGYLTEATLSISNGVTPNKALGVLGAFDTSSGNFEVSGSLTAYFSSIAACKAIRQNADVGFSGIFAAKGKGFVFDIPLIGLGGGRVNVEKDNPIMIPVEPNGAESKYGHTALYARFDYLPNVAMPSR